MGGRYSGPLMPQPARKKAQGKNKMRDLFSIIDKSSMTEREFLELSDKTFDEVESLIDDDYPEADYEREGNVLTITLEDGKSVVINRQEVMQEIWLASPLGGRHFRYVERQNLIDTRDGKSFLEYLRSAMGC